MSSSLACPADFGFVSPHHLRSQFLKINPSLCAHTRSLWVLCLWRTLRPEAPSRAGSENLLSLLLGPDSCVSVTSGPHSCMDCPVLSACPEWGTVGLCCLWPDCTLLVGNPLSILESCFPTFGWPVHLSAVLPVLPLQITPEMGFLRLPGLPPRASTQVPLTPPEIRAAFL